MVVFANEELLRDCQIQWNMYVESMIARQNPKDTQNQVKRAVSPTASFSMFSLCGNIVSRFWQKHPVHS
jgi:hypothetical protein